MDRETPRLLPPDLRDWVPEDPLVHFVIDAVAPLDVSAARLNERGSGSEPYPPAMRLALLVYSDSTGVFASRRIEQATHDNVAVRLLCADTHPDPDTICTFRRHNRERLAHAFAQLLELAARCGQLQVGDITVAVDGTKSLAKADAADATPLRDGLTVEGELARRHERKARLARARAEIEARAFAKAQAERAQKQPDQPGPPPPAAPATSFASKPSNRSSGSSRKHSACDASFCAVWRRGRWKGHW